MSRPLTPQEILTTFDRWGVPHAEVPGWQHRTTPSGWSDEGPVGCMHHSTGNDASDEANRELLTNGRSGLSGPLANFGVTDNGRVDIIAAGSANHAGGGDPSVLEAVRSQSYDDAPPAAGMHHGSPGAVGGNGRFYGFDAYFGGPNDLRIAPRQYRALVLSTTAVVSALAALEGPTVTRTAKSVIGHKEWTDHKLDPKDVDMSDARSDVQWCLDHGPAAARHWFATGIRLAEAG